MILKLLLCSLLSVSGFFNPSTRLQSGKTITLMGKGPPLLFSSGIYGTIPKFVYNEFLNGLRKNFTIITIDGFNPITYDDIDDVANTIKTDKLAYVSHSSFQPEILESPRINTAVLFDPISIPKVNFNGVEGYTIDLDYPLLIIKADKLYNAVNPLPEWQNIEFNGEVNYELYKDVGHPDILDDNWANIAKRLGLWEMAEGKTMNFKEWKFDSKNSIPQIRKNYRKYAYIRVSEFINNNINTNIK